MIGKIVVVGVACLLLLGLFVFPFMGWTPKGPPCCVTEKANSTGGYEYTSCGKFGCWDNWMVSFHVYAVSPRGLADQLADTNGTISMRCNYYFINIGANMTLNRNIQQATLPFGGFGIVANDTGSGFTTIAGAPGGC